MAHDYNEYLAANVLNEQQYVTYRLLSRALKVHSNLAKQMLYEFHRKQNGKKPGSVHATYLLTGIRRIQAPQHTNGIKEEDGEDTVMQSSPPLPSSSIPMQDEMKEETKLVRTVLLVKEEDLDQAKITFDTISSIHIYSLEANTLKDLHVLTECNRKVAAEYASEDPMETWKQYGTIHNPNAKRRARGTAPPPPPPPVAKIADAKAKAAAQVITQKEAADLKPSSKPPSKTATPEPDKKGTTKPPATKRQNSSIFKSFAKAKDKPTPPPKNDSQGSASASPAPAAEDVPMTGFSDDELDDDPPEEAEEVSVPAGKSKTERKAELEAMMDDADADAEMEDAPTPADASPGAETPVEEAEEPKAEEPKETMTVSNGRRRGKRRVMKKKTMKDEEGYIVTKEEAAWESFSEEEPAPKKAKLPPAASTSAASKKEAVKKGAKPGQGNIMSFFGKK